MIQDLLLMAACAYPAQVSIPLWALVHLPVVVTITTAVFTPKARTCSAVPMTPLRTQLAVLQGCAALQLCVISQHERLWLLQVFQHAMRQSLNKVLMHVLQGWLHCILYVLFENAMGIVKLWAVIAGAPDASQPAQPLHCCMHARSIRPACIHAWTGITPG